MNRNVTGARVEPFHRQLEARVEAWLGSEEAASIPCAVLYRHLPALYAFLVRLALDARIAERERGAIMSGLKYIVAPYDLIPEGALGTSALRDDLVLAAMVVDRLYSVADPATLDLHWNAPGEPRAIASLILDAAASLVGEEICDHLRHWLPEPVCH
jgi:uncharacterized membrane protein YkvA (DUF1232 family)